MREGLGDVGGFASPLSSPPMGQIGAALLVGGHAHHQKARCQMTVTWTPLENVAGPLLAPEQPTDRHAQRATGHGIAWKLIWWFR